MMILLFLAACGGEGTWTLTTWGEEYIEEGIPSSAFADGCSMEFDSFDIVMGERALVNGDGEVVGELDGYDVWHLTEPGPQLQGSLTVPATHYDSVHVRVAPFDEEASVHVVGTLTCGDASVDVDWPFTTDTTYYCEPEELTIPAGGEDSTEITIHGDHLFYDGLEDPAAVIRGQAIVDADADNDGLVTLDELAQVSVAELGYTVGSHSDVTDLEAYIAKLTQTLGHVDGEGHCQVN